MGLADLNQVRATFTWHKSGRSPAGSSEGILAKAGKTQIFLDPFVYVYHKALVSPMTSPEQAFYFAGAEEAVYGHCDPCCPELPG